MPEPAVGRPLRKRVTRQDVARLAGVSLPVVTYVLNDGPKYVSPATREKVLEAVAQLGYRPNAAARALRRGRSELIGLIVPNISNALFSALAREVELAAHEHGSTLIVLSAAPGAVQEGLDRLAARQVDGVLIATPLRSADVAAVELCGIPSLLLNQPNAIEGIPTIAVDLYGGARLAVDHLIAQGYERIGYLGPLTGDLRRRQGWEDAVTARGLTPGAALASPFTREGGYAAGAELLRQSPRPDAVFAGSDQIALGALRAFHEAGVAVPEDIAIVSFDGSPDAEYAWPQLSSVRQPIARMASDAVAHLLNGADPDFSQYPVELVTRASSAPKRAR